MKEAMTKQLDTMIDNGGTHKTLHIDFERIEVMLDAGFSFEEIRKFLNASCAIFFNRPRASVHITNLKVY